MPEDRESSEEKPIHFIETVVPRRVLFGGNPEDRPKKLLKLLSKTDGISSMVNSAPDALVFRGFVRDADLKSPASAASSEMIIHNLGHEKEVGEMGDDFNTTPIPLAALAHAIPKRREQVGYLMVYDNDDGFFTPSGREWMKIGEINQKTSFRDRLHAVVVIKPGRLL